MNNETTLKMAKLARLKLTDVEVETFTPQLGSILQYVESLAKVDTSKVEPLYHPHASATFLREDRVEEFPSEIILNTAPEIQDRGFKVPPILDGE